MKEECKLPVYEATASATASIREISIVSLNTKGITKRIRAWNIQNKIMKLYNL